MDVFVLPSKAEGISNTILEAMSCGLPVIATDVGGNAELVEHNANGYIVPASDPLALAKAMSGYLTSPDNIKKHGVQSRQRIEQKFSIDNMVNQYQTVYKASL